MTTYNLRLRAQSQQNVQIEADSLEQALELAKDIEFMFENSEPIHTSVQIHCSTEDNDDNLTEEEILFIQRNFAE